MNNINTARSKVLQRVQLHLISPRLVLTTDLPVLKIENIHQEWGCGYQAQHCWVLSGAHKCSVPVWKIHLCHLIHLGMGKILVEI